ncbi:Concanavalin A-like lectin/glucanase domain containing protein [Elaphomyces granulatus]
MDQARVKLTEELLQGIRVPEPPPKNFCPLEASDPLLKKHGLPRRPNKDLYPQLYASWERLMSRPLTLIQPEFEIITVARTAETTKTSKTWSGAVNRDLESGDKFNYIQASWMVPKPFPPNSSWNGTSWTETSKHDCGIWVGIGGYHSTHNIIQAGTGEYVSVDKDGNITQGFHVWFEWFPAGQVAFANFPVCAGELVSCGDESDDSTDYYEATGKVTFINQSTCTYTSVGMKFKTTKYKDRFVGDCAEWIVEGHKQKQDDKKSTMPFLGATFMYDCLATTEKYKFKNLKNAVLVDLVEEGSNISLSSAERENDTVLGVFTWPRTVNMEEVSQEDYSTTDSD